VENPCKALFAMAGIVVYWSTNIVIGI